MPRFAANLSTMFRELPFLERFAAARAAGFEAVECQQPYGAPKEEIARRLADHGQILVLHNTPEGGAEDKGIACHPGREAEFRESFRLAVDYAHHLGCPHLHLMAGVAPEGAEPAALRGTYLANLAWAAEHGAPAGVMPLVEAINTTDLPGFYVCRVDQAIGMIEAAGHDNLGLQYDFYHRQMMEGALMAGFEAARPHIRHVQVSDVPGRHEPGSGEIAYDHIFARLDAQGYDGWIGCEYTPAAGTIEGLGWIGPWRPA